MIPLVIVIAAILWLLAAGAAWALCVQAKRLDERDGRGD